MRYTEIITDNIINEITKKDELFNGNYTIDPYQNCEFGCKYCDSSFDDTIYIKKNATEIFLKDIKKIRKGKIIIGSVHDPYQKAEKRYKITRKLLKIIRDNNQKCHILTKSDLVLNDIDILKEIKDCQVIFSVTSLNQKIFNLFEKNVPSPKIRLNSLKILSENNINSGLAIIPIIPYIIESEIEEIVKQAKNHKSRYVLYKHLELKGDQKSYFFELLQKKLPQLFKKYEELYSGSYKPKDEYIKNIEKLIKNKSLKYNISNELN